MSDISFTNAMIMTDQSPLPDNFDAALAEVIYLRKALHLANCKVAAKVVDLELVKRSMAGAVKSLNAENMDLKKQMLQLTKKEI